MAWLSGWGNRVKLTADAGDIDAALSNFPILLYISTSSGRNSDDISFVFDELQSDANRKKIAVTTSDGETQCYVEIEKWDDASEKAWLWVKAPSVSNTVDTDLYLYYDSSHADNTTYVGDPNSTPAENVWDSNFKFVSHMRDDPDTSHVRDSTGNNNDGTKKGAAEPALTASGKINGAQHFDGSDDHVELSDNSFEADSQGTIEAWIKRDIASRDNDIILSSTEQAEKNQLNFIVSEASGYDLLVQHYILGVHNDVVYGSTVLGTGEHHVVVTSNGTAWALYVDGAAEGLNILVGSNTGDWFADLAVGTHKVRIGQRTYGTTTHHYYDGIIDEFRVSSINRSAAWIKATYETGRDNLLDWGSEETEVVVPTAGVLAATNIGHTVARINGEIVDDGGGVCEARFRYRIKRADVLAIASIYDDPHGMVYYDGYVYVISRHPSLPRLYKISATDYASSSYITLGGNGLTDLIREGNYLWASCYDGKVYKVDISTFTESASYNIGSDCESLCSDGTYVFVGCKDGVIGKITISNGTVDTNDLGDHTFHSICEDGSYLYAFDHYGELSYKLYKIQKSDLTSIGNVDIEGACPDDLAQDGTYVYLGKEGGTKGIKRVTKSDLSIITESPTGIGWSYGVFNVGGDILLLDYENNHIWRFDSSLTLLADVEIGGLGAFDSINELVDDGTYLHLTTWSPEGILKLDKAVVLADWTTTDWQNSLETDDEYYEDLTALSPGTKYEFQTQAKNSAGEGDWTSSAYFETLKGQPIMRRWGGSILPTGAQRIGKGW